MIYAFKWMYICSGHGYCCLLHVRDKYIYIYRDRKPLIWGENNQTVAAFSNAGVCVELWFVCSILAKCGNALEKFSRQRRHLNDPGEGSEGVLPIWIGWECVPQGCGDKGSSLHWALPMELLNMSNTAAYSVRLSSFVSMSSLQDHHSHCLFVSPILRHLVPSQEPAGDLLYVMRGA